MMNAKPVNNAILMICAAALCVGVSTGCDKSAETKYEEASNAVKSEVTFDGPSGSASPSREEVAASPEPSVGLADEAEMEAPEEGVVNKMRMPRVKRGAKMMAGASGGRGVHNIVAPPPAQKPTSAPADTGAKNAAVNPMTRVADDALSTFSIDVDTGAYTLARRAINSGAMPSPGTVRVEEFVNYFKYDYPAPKDGAFGVSLDAAPSPFEPALNRKIVRVGVQGKRLNRESRKPVHLTFLVDVSGSMSGHDRIELAKESLQILTRNLGEEDTIAISTYSGAVKTILEPTGAAQRAKISKAIDSLSAGGGTRMGDGLELAYKMALKGFVADHANRVIVLSDGDANVGATTFPEILSTIRSYVEDGVTLSTIGFGMGNYKDQMMEQLANQGNGNYYYIDSKKEAQKVFGEQLDGTLQVIAKDVKIQVEFDADSVISYRLLGYENRDIADNDFRNDRVDAGEIGAGHSVTALYEVVLSEAAARGKAISQLATVRIRAKTPTGTQAREQAFVLTTRDMHAKLADASQDFQFATAVAGFAEVLRDSPYAKGLSLALVEELAKSASTPAQADRQEFIGLVAKVKASKSASAGVLLD
ncbi:vWA domain-containing protein [Bradymonas sediminis]|uniref:VWA domain-containing protein n=1 Tax=Bradymonas sediminis TaxID=1548548 RepID=A0A2Z4FQ52_9DELT|nr:von Willebrand factor type A domain-containing protein [Bradymonas sediminis]AWV90786.1 VWA domain-containing protein [Bradymonas sediminis]TDP75480.1 Ca-activated chloride channel family protein [Bradymonas sediminis]